MKVAIVGNRIGWECNNVLAYIYEKLKNMGFDYDCDEIVSGGAVGVDSFAQEFARLYGIKMVIMYPTGAMPSPEKYHDRNRRIVNYSDAVIAFQNKNSGGTQFTINYAKKKGKTVIIIHGAWNLDCSRQTLHDFKNMDNKTKCKLCGKTVGEVKNAAAKEMM
jgi:predicted Rossmann fold nucleotide-binding protein DprA/Smf involved in DNA uptake